MGLVYDAAQLKYISPAGKKIDHCPLARFLGDKNIISSKSPFFFSKSPFLESQLLEPSRQALSSSSVGGGMASSCPGDGPSTARLTARGSPQASASRPCRPSKPRRRTVVPIDMALGPLCLPAPILLLAPLHPMPPLHCRRRGAATGRREHHVPRSIPPPAWSAGKLALKKLTVFTSR